MSYYWRECVSGQHVAETVQFLLRLVESLRGCTSNPYLDAENEALFEDRLERAQAGALVPNDHVKSIRFDPDLDLFEIRWIDVGVIPEDLVSGLKGPREDIHVRLYYLEEGSAWVVGMHGHVKEFPRSGDGSIDENETERLQDEQIKRAVAHVDAGEATRWGIPELERSP